MGSLTSDWIRNFITNLMPTDQASFLAEGYSLRGGGEMGGQVDESGGRQTSESFWDPLYGG